MSLQRRFAIKFANKFSNSNTSQTHGKVELMKNKHLLKKNANRAIHTFFVCYSHLLRFEHVQTGSHEFLSNNFFSPII